jgi:hypothetical protein
MNKMWQEKSKEAMKADWKMIWQGCLVRDLETDYWTRVITTYSPNLSDWHFLGVQAALKSHSGKQADVYLDLTDAATVGCIQREIEKVCDYYEFQLVWERQPLYAASWNVKVTDTRRKKDVFSSHKNGRNEDCLGVLALRTLEWARGYEE